MFWLWIVIISQFFNAGAMFLDKFLLSKRFPRPAVLTFWTAVWNLLGLVFIFWNFDFLPGPKILFCSILSGIFFTLALQFFYMALKRGEATHISPLVGAVVPVGSFVISYFWLGELLNFNQTIAVVCLVFGALVVSFETTESRKGWHIGMLWAVIAGLFFATSYTIMRGVFLETNFSTGFVWARAGAFLAALPFLCSRPVRNSLFKAQKNQSKRQTLSGLVILAINKSLAALYFLGMTFALTMASATLVNSLAGLQYAILFILIFFISKIRPAVLREHFTRSEIIQEIIAIAFIMLGLGLLVM